MVGRTVSHYKIVHKIGEGGMGVVYKAEDTRLHRPVALKFLPSEAVTGKQKERFVNEAQAASLVHHPNICPIYDIDEVEGQLFLVMAFLEGHDLRRVLADRPLAIRQAVGLAIQIANGLESAHAHGVIHRDIKCSNILVSDQWHASILDFGLALLSGADRITRTGGRVGTVAYMSPEQAQGLAVDHRTDIWSLGVVLYEMVTGQLPFRRDNELAVIHGIISDQTPSLSASRQDVPGELQRAIDRALAKDPDQRFSGANQLAAVLQRIEDSQIVEGAAKMISTRASTVEFTASNEAVVTSPSADPNQRDTAPTLTQDADARQQRTIQQPRRWMHPSAGRIAALAGLCLIAVLVFWWLSSRGFFTPGEGQFPEEKHVAVLPFETFGSDSDLRALSDGLVETVTAKLSQLEQFQGKLMVVPSSEIRRRGIGSAEDARRIYGTNLVITGSAQPIGNRIELTVNLVDAERIRQLGAATIQADRDDLLSLREDTINSVVRLLRIELTPVAQQNLKSGDTGSAAAFAAYLRGRGFLARYDVEGNVDRAIVSFQDATDRDSGFALAYAGLGEAQWWKALTTNDKQWAERAVENVERAVALNQDVAVIRVKLGEVYTDRGRYDDAIQEFGRALELAPGSAEAQRGLAWAYMSMGKFDEAEAAYQKAVSQRPTDWYSHLLLGWFYTQTGRNQEGESAYREALSLTPDNDIVLRNLAVVYLTLGRYKDAREHLQKSLTLEASASSYNTLGVVYYYERRYPESVAAYETSLDLNAEEYSTWGNLGSAYRRTAGGDAKAEAAFRRAIELGGKALEVTPDNHRVRANLAEYWAKLGESKRALAEISQIPPNVRQAYPIQVALAYEITGRRDEAIDTLNSSEAYGLLQIRDDPEFADLWADPSYQNTIGTDQPRD
jgi:serine/threonine protein kinase/tetratricopeptide (TPR) repeat protein/TolB-like protein